MLDSTSKPRRGVPKQDIRVLAHVHNQLYNFNFGFGSSIASKVSITCSIMMGVDNYLISAMMELIADSEMSMLESN